MDINQNPYPRDADRVLHSDGDDLRDVPAPTLHLVRAIGARLRAPLSARRRDELARELAAIAVTGVEPDAQAALDVSGDRIAAGGLGSTGPRRQRPGAPGSSPRARTMRRLSAAAAALVVLAGGVGVISRSGDDLPMIVLAAGPAAGPASAMDAAGGFEGGATEPAMDGRMMWWVPTVYRFALADGVSFAAGQAPAWRLVRPADLAAAAAPIAATLGVPALGPSEWEADALRSESESAGSLWVGPSGDWYYSGPAHLWPVWDCPDFDPADATRPTEPAEAGEGSIEPAPVQECTPPAPPVGVPSADRARELAVAFLATVGHRDVRVTDVWADEWGAWVTAEPSLGGLPSGTGMTVSVGFGAGGRVTSANGTLATVERVGEYPTIDAAAAILRLQEDLNAWQAGGPVARPLPADADLDAPVSDGDSPVTILPVPEGDAPLPGTLPGPDGEVEPVELDVTIVSVELISMLVWTATGDMLVLPHYRLVDSDGGWWFVVAVSDRYLSR